MKREEDEKGRKGDSGERGVRKERNKRKKKGLQQAMGPAATGPHHGNCETGEWTKKGKWKRENTNVMASHHNLLLVGDKKKEIVTEKEISEN